MPFPRNVGCEVRMRFNSVKPIQEARTGLSLTASTSNSRASAYAQQHFGVLETAEVHRSGKFILLDSLKHVASIAIVVIRTNWCRNPLTIPRRCVVAGFPGLC